ncbi:MAG: hypothetical protein WBE75_02705 [Candidatus Omnitrophota bacterium]|jgi:hypothetical protein
MNIGRKEKIEWAITGVLLLVFLAAFLATRMHGRSSGRKAAAGGAAVPLPSAMLPAGQGDHLFVSLQDKSARISLKRDPFYGTQISGAGAGDNGVIGVSLAGIFWDSDKPRAIINGRIAGPGDEVDGVRVKEIRRDRVILENGGRETELKLER